MRIFNWVHRRFIPKDDGQKLRKDEQQEIQVNEHGDTKALLFKDYHAILSIGTFGQISTAITTADHHGDPQSDESWDEDDDEDAIVEADDEYSYQQEHEEDPLLIPAEDENENDEMKRKERTTLAELFSAESEEDDDGHRQLNKSSKGLLFVRKKMMNKDDGLKKDSRPIHKLHGMMKRMLKRKIHPAAADDAAKPPASLHPSRLINKSVSRPDAPTHQELWT